MCLNSYYGNTRRAPGECKCVQVCVSVSECRPRGTNLTSGYVSTGKYGLSKMPSLERLAGFCCRRVFCVAWMGTLTSSYSNRTTNLIRTRLQCHELGKLVSSSVFRLFTVELSLLKRTWIFRRLLFCVEIGTEIKLKLASLSLPSSNWNSTLVPVTVAHSCISSPLKIHLR